MKFDKFPTPRIEFPKMDRSQIDELDVIPLPEESLLQDLLAHEDPLGEFVIRAQGDQSSPVFSLNVILELCHRLGDALPAHHPTAAEVVLGLIATHGDVDLADEFRQAYGRARLAGADVDAALDEIVSDDRHEVAVVGALVLAHLAPGARSGVLSDEGLESYVLGFLFEDLRAPAATALALRGRWDVLERIFESGNGSARGAVAEACGAVDAPESDQLLIRGLRDEDGWVVACALQSACERPNGEKVWSVLWTLPTSGTRKGRRAFKMAFDDIARALDGTHTGPGSPGNATR